MTKLASAHRLSYFEVIDGPVFWSEFSWLLLLELVCHYFNLLIINILFIFDLDQWSLLHFGH